MNRFAGHQALVPILSRLMPRGARVRCGAVNSGLRVLALLALAPILFGLGASVGIGGGDAATTVHVAPSVGSLPALHVVHAYRLGVEARAHSRAHAPVDAAPSMLDPMGASVMSSRRALAISAIAQPRPAAVDRGYDATAPPALS